MLFDKPFQCFGIEAYNARQCVELYPIQLMSDVIEMPHRLILRSNKNLRFQYTSTPSAIRMFVERITNSDREQTLQLTLFKLK
mmetsp:Transcript_50317/g.88982  ORF Transcript_50317/g.88982 Transcript_50317/m.88982 type:complete len:83 (+) Transcript_50317:885-1133(+)